MFHFFYVFVYNYSGSYSINLDSSHKSNAAIYAALEPRGTYIGYDALINGAVYCNLLELFLIIVTLFSS